MYDAAILWTVLAVLWAEYIRGMVGQEADSNVVAMAHKTGPDATQRTSLTRWPCSGPPLKHCTWRQDSPTALVLVTCLIVVHLLSYSPKRDEATLTQFSLEMRPLECLEPSPHPPLSFYL